VGSLGLKRNPKFKQGYYKPIDPSKVIGNTPIIYRSGIELKFFRFLDTNPNVIKWMSEPFAIPYYDSVQRKQRRYYVDNYVEILEGKILKKYLIEIKDIKETKKPNPKSKKKKTTLIYEQMRWCNNNDKWVSANKFCKDHNMEFLLIGHSNKNGFESISLNL
jgi:hypothetical protein|tara:strand:- start:8467 stop:8952 length:486 start_codon:yes stop_codon:yes gene_type:complete